MKVTAVIAEYNPFHNGHAYQLAEARRLTQADYVIVIMSGDFVQRGTPAILDKYSRTRAALSHGADLVLELPTLWATSSADYFAEGAISILSGLSIVNALSFGTECEDLSHLQELVELTAEEKPSYQEDLNAFLKEGKSYAAAKSLALEKQLKEEEKLSEEKIQELLAALKGPNNILALSYLSALKKKGNAIEPLPILRKGADYHNDSLQEDFSSATAIRKACESLLSDGFLNSSATYPDTFSGAYSDLFSNLRKNLPSVSASILIDAIEKKSIVTSRNLDDLLFYILRTEDSSSLAQIADANLDLANRAKNLLSQYQGFDSFAEELDSIQMTRLRIQRFFLHSILGITEDFRQEAQASNYAPYARVLGLRKDATELLSALSKTAEIPLLVNLAKDEEALSPIAHRVFEKDLLAADLYQSFSGQGTLTEYTRPLMLVP